MEFYTLEVKQELRHDIESSMNNIKRCISFVAGLEGDKADYELGECSKEFLILKNLKEDIEFSIDSGEVVYVADVDYFLVRRWHEFSLETYKNHFLHKQGAIFYHG